MVKATPSTVGGSSRLSDEALGLLTDPDVLWAAWTRVKSWYRGSDLKPEAEFAQWRIAPEANLQELANQIAKGQYAPAVFPLVPYPKKGATLRHYCMPSVRDQVAFMLPLVLLAPWLDSQMTSLSFGNRWYRGIAPDRADSTGCWKERPFALGDRAPYQPYRRSHGLFRRVCHWSALRLLGQNLSNTDAYGETVSPRDYPSRSLPPWLCDSADWWARPGREATSRVFWAHLDLQCAFPSIRMDVLERKLTTLSADTKGAADFDVESVGSTRLDLAKGPYDGYPSSIATLLDGAAGRQNRIDLAILLASWLRQVRYRPFSGDWRWWPPHHEPQTLPDENAADHPGLPTGLAVSGFLQNVCLDGVDEWMKDWAKMTRGGFLRFADDMIVLAGSPGDLCDGIETSWKAIQDDKELGFGEVLTGTAGTNLFFNWAKIEPEPVRKVVTSFLTSPACGWHECKCGGLVAPDPKPRRQGPGHVTGLAEWVEHPTVGDDDSQTELIEDLDSIALTADGLGPFVTYLVERLSALGCERATARSGERAENRLTELHGLVRNPADDEQVRRDTCATFASNQLTSCWLPGDVERQRAEIAQIRKTIETAIKANPWKSQLWKAAVRSAARRPFGSDNASRDDKSADEWLAGLLRWVSTNGSWLSQWPEKPDRARRSCAEHESPLPRETELFHLSYVRAAFWCALAEVLRELDGALSPTDERDESPKNETTSFEALDSSWIVRSVPADAFAAVRKWLGNFETWSSALYLDTLDGRFWWEWDSVLLAVLASHSRSELVAESRHRGGWKHLSGSFDRCLAIPGTWLPSRLRSIAYSEHSDSCDVWSLGLLASRSSDDRASLGKQISDSVAGNEPIGWLLTASRAHGLLPFLTERVVRSAKHLVDRFINEFRDDAAQSNRSRTEVRWALVEYGIARRLMLSAGPCGGSSTNKRAAPTIHRLLWGDAWANKHVRTWAIDPAQVPAVGLPVRVCLAMLTDALQSEQVSSRSAPGDADSFGDWPSVWVLSKHAHAALSWGRRLLLDIESHGERRDNERIPGEIIENDSRFEAWEVPPHEAYFLPWMYPPATAGRVRVFSSVLQFLTALSGDERLLDSIYQHSVSSIPYEDRMDLRSRIPLSAGVWRNLDRVIKVAQLGERRGTDSGAQVLLDAVAKAFDAPLTRGDFRWERVDVLLDFAEDDGDELPVAVSPHPPTNRPFRAPSDPAESMRVRIAQIAAEPNWGRYLAWTFPTIHIEDRTKLLDSIHAAYQAEPRTKDEIDLVVMPEVTLPPRATGAVLNLVKDTGRAVLVGCLWRALPSAVRPSASVTVRRMYLVNEALAAFRLEPAGRSGTPVVRHFFVRKPIPTHVEYALASVRNDIEPSSGSRWHILPGRRWYRFVHPRWADFTVAVCSDLLDPTPWASMRGQIAHMFVSSYNDDVDLFQSMTWVRAYENYVNVALANHGTPGGSFAWTPKRGHGNELLSIRGRGIDTLADIELPVAALLREQIDGLENSRRRERSVWEDELCNYLDPEKEQRPERVRRTKRGFKSVPPCYPGRLPEEP